MIDDSYYGVRSTSGDKIYTVTASKSGWTCSCPDYARHNAKCKHVNAIEYYHSQSSTSLLNQAVRRATISYTTNEQSIILLNPHPVILEIVSSI